MRLGELLVKDRVVNGEQLEEALASQVVHGGRLGTNLLELGILSEKRLAEALGRLHGMPFVFGDLTPDPRALALVSAKLADDKDVVPLGLEANRLALAVMTPIDIATQDLIAYRTGKRVRAAVAPEARINALLREHYRAIRPLRAVKLKKGGTPAPFRRGPAVDLMSEEAFDALYQPAPAPAREPVAREPAAAEPDALLLTEAEIVPEPEVAEPPPPEPVLSPLSFAEANVELRTSADREAVATTVLRFARSKFKRSLLLSVHKDAISGWRATGEGVSERTMKELVLSLDEPSSFKLVRDTCSHFIGAVRDTPEQAFYPLLGGGPPKTAVLMPLLARGKVVHLLYVDNGPGALTPPDVGELLILSQGVARSYEALIQSRARRAG